MQFFSFDVPEIPAPFQALVGINFVKLSALYYLYKYGEKPWVWAGKVCELFIHPVKSCGGISVDDLEITVDGGKYKNVKDRHWMIVDAQGQRATQRTIENIALITQHITDDKLVLKAPGMSPLELEIHPKFDETQVIEITISGKQMKVLYAGDHAAVWMNKFLKKDDLKVVHLPPDLQSMDMTLLNKPNNYYARKGDVKGLHDKAPFNMLGRATVDDLQSRIPDENIDVRRFRPNILEEDSLPYDEDNWQRVMIGDTIFTRVAMCSRCIFTTVDQDKPNKAGRDLEPLKTLRTYRLAPEKNNYGQSPILAAHFCPDNVGGTIYVGDDVLVIREHY